MELDTFGKRLKWCRQTRGVTQRELRDRMEALTGIAIGETYISELERTDKMPVWKVAARTHSGALSH